MLISATSGEQNLLASDFLVLFGFLLSSVLIPKLKLGHFWVTASVAGKPNGAKVSHTGLIANVYV